MDNVEEVIRHLDQVDLDKTKFHEMLGEAFERILPAGSTSRTLALAGAAVSVPLALGYIYNNYVNSKKIKEKLTWEQLKSGANIISRVFSNYHVKYIFSLSETECDPIIECCSSLRIKVIKMKNINNALNAADGIYRATEQVGCIFVSTSQDLLALSNTTINFPLLVIGINELMDSDKGMMGSVQSENFPIWSLHSFKSCEFVKSITEIAPTLEKSLDRCMQSPFGPMYLEFSQEMIVPEGEIQKNNMLMNQSKWYFKRVWNDLQHSFTYPSSDTEVVFHHFQKDSVKSPKADQIREVLDLIYEAENPLLLLGDQCLTSGQYEDEVLRNDSLKLSIKLLGLPTFLTGFTKVLNDSSFQNVIYDNMEYALKHSDLIISCGIPTNILNDLLEHHQQHISDNLSKKRMVIVDTLMSSKGFSLFGGHGIHRSFFESIKRTNYRVEPSTFLHHLGYMMPRNYNKFQSWIMDLKEKDSISSLIFDKKSKFKGEHLNSYLVLEALRDSLQNSQSRPIVVCDNGQFEECAHSLLSDCVRAWIQLDHTCVRHNTNSAIGLAIASKLCNPSVDVWLLCDDRSISQCIPEFETLNRYHIPINIVVGNVEGSISEMSDDQVMIDKDSKKSVPQIHHDHPKTAFHKIMVAYGGKSFSLSHNNAKREELEKSFAEARERSTVSQRPILINCHIDKPVPSLIGGGAM